MGKPGYLACVLALAGATLPQHALAQATAGSISVESVQGTAFAGAARLAEGASLEMPISIDTEPGAQVQLRLTGGTLLVLDESTRLRVVDLRQAGPAVRIVLDLIGGSVRTITPASAEAGRLSIRTPQGSFEIAGPADFSVAAMGDAYLRIERGPVTAAARQRSVELGSGSVAVIRSDGALVEGARVADLPARITSAFARLANAHAAQPRVQAAERGERPAQKAREPAAVAPSQKASGDRKAYVGGAFGRSSFQQGIVIGPLIDSGEVDTTSNGFKAFAGYNFLTYLGAELAYVDLGKVQYQGVFGSTPIMGGTLKVRGANMSAVGNLPLGESAVLFGKLGIFAWEKKASDDGGGTAFSSKATGRDLSYGAGVGYNFTSSFGARAEFEKLKIGKSSATLLSLGLLYRF